MKVSLRGSSNKSFKDVWEKEPIAHISVLMQLGWFSHFETVLQHSNLVAHKVSDISTVIPPVIKPNMSQGLRNFCVSILLYRGRSRPPSSNLCARKATDSILTTVNNYVGPHGCVFFAHSHEACSTTL